MDNGQYFPAKIVEQKNDIGRLSYAIQYADGRIVHSGFASHEIAAESLVRLAAPNLLQTLRSIAASDPDHTHFATLVVNAARDAIEEATGERPELLKPHRSASRRERALESLIRRALPFIDGHKAYSAKMIDEMRAAAGEQP